MEFSDSESDGEDIIRRIEVRMNNERRQPQVIPPRHVIYFLILTLTAAVLLEVLPIGVLQFAPRRANKNKINRTAQQNDTRPTYALYSGNENYDHLVHVKNVLNYLGYRQVHSDDDWDLLWSFEYPYTRFPTRSRNLLPHQVVNHVPGCGHITNKINLSTAGLPFMPKAFRLPSEKNIFLAYAQNNPSKLFVEKHNEHRFVSIKTPFNVSLMSNNIFVQEYIQNPYLVDGYKFDIGAYVVITSVRPLRAYIYKGDILFRYCSQKYNPFNPIRLEKYVVGDNYLPTWEIPSLKKFYLRFGGSMRAAFDAYVRDQHQDPSIIWTQVEDIIRITLLSQEDVIASVWDKYKVPHYFELLRFDFIIDRDFKVFLMEANMSPNLSSAHFQPNALLYEQLLYSVLNLVGVGSYLQHNNKNGSEQVSQMFVEDKNLAVDLNRCVNYYCDKSCNMEECDLCLVCLKGSDYRSLKKAHGEHLHKMDMRRIFPKPILNMTGFDLKKEVVDMTTANAWMTKWFYEKCKFDQSWCS